MRSANIAANRLWAIRQALPGVLPGCRAAWLEHRAPRDQKWHTTGSSGRRSRVTPRRPRSNVTSSSHSGPRANVTQAYLAASSASGGSARSGAVTFTAVMDRAPFEWMNVPRFARRRRSESDSGKPSAAIDLGTTKSLGPDVSLAAEMISIEAPGSIHGERTARVGNGRESGAPRNRRSPIPNGDQPLERHSDWR